MGNQSGISSIGRASDFQSECHQFESDMPLQIHATIRAITLTAHSMQTLLQYAQTDRQREIIEAIIEHGSQRKACKALGVHKGTITSALDKVKRHAAQKGHSPEHDMVHTVPDGYKVKGVSTLYSDGVVKAQWVKSDIDRERQLEIMREAIEALCADIKPVASSQFANHVQGDLMTVYPIGDAHIGMRAWHEECGEDWDMEIAERVFNGVFGRLIAAAPASSEAVIINLGDWLHADNLDGVTERSGHSLDMDGRYPKMISVAMRILRHIIHAALRKHQTVRVINAIGNHDDTGAMWLSVALRNIYENEPRVIIDKSPTPFHYVRFGKVLIGAHHGHTCKADKLPLVMATDRAKDWGDTEFRYWHTGHIHHDTLKEYPGVKVESFRTLAGKDAYATWNGYRSGQDSKAIVYHREFGEVERHTVNIAMVK